MRRRSCLPRDVVLELLDAEFLLGDHVLYQVAEIHQAYDLALLEHRQVAEPVLGHLLPKLPKRAIRARLIVITPVVPSLPLRLACAPLEPSALDPRIAASPPRAARVVQRNVEGSSYLSSVFVALQVAQVGERDVVKLKIGAARRGEVRNCPAVGARARWCPGRLADGASRATEW